jgi:hypothetical protein
MENESQLRLGVISLVKSQREGKEIASKKAFATTLFPKLKVETIEVSSRQGHQPGVHQFTLQMTQQSGRHSSMKNRSRNDVESTSTYNNTQPFLYTKHEGRLDTIRTPEPRQFEAINSRSIESASQYTMKSMRQDKKKSFPLKPSVMALLNKRKKMKGTGGLNEDEEKVVKVLEKFLDVKLKQENNKHIRPEIDGAATIDFPVFAPESRYQDEPKKIFNLESAFQDNILHGIVGGGGTMPINSKSITIPSKKQRDMLPKDERMHSLLIRRITQPEEKIAKDIGVRTLSVNYSEREMMESTDNPNLKSMSYHRAMRRTFMQ